MYIGGIITLVYLGVILNCSLQILDVCSVNEGGLHTKIAQDLSKVAMASCRENGWMSVCVTLLASL